MMPGGNQSTGWLVALTSVIALASPSICLAEIPAEEVEAVIEEASVEAGAEVSQALSPPTEQPPTEQPPTEQPITPPAMTDDVALGSSAADSQDPPAADESAAPSHTWANLRETLRLDLGLTYTSFEQQVKSEVGGASVTPLVQDRSFGMAFSATYAVWRFIRLGLFMQLDVGTRRQAAFRTLDTDGTPLVTDAVGGSYWEYWLGPLLRLQWRGLAFEVGYGALGLRGDDARTDLATDDGETGTFRTSPRVAWHFALTGYIPVHAQIDVVLRVQYRIRYYDSRGGEDLRESVVHGTQNLTPTVGVSWHL